MQPTAPAVLSRRATLGLGLAAFALHGRGAAPARAAASSPDAAWPDRPVRLITPGGPGSGIDLIARLLGEGLARRLGQPFPVENRPGAESVLAAEAHTRARPGEALLLASATVASTVPLVHERVPYDAADLVPVTAAATEFLCLLVPETLPVTSVAEFLDHARARPGALNWFAVPGLTGLTALSFRLLMRERGLDLTYVAYRGSPPAVLDLIAGRLQAAFLPLTAALGPIREGRLRPLAVTAGRRAPALPEVPTAAEAGFPELQVEAVIALFGWRGITEALRERLAAEAGAVLREPAVAERLRAGGMLPSPGTPAELAAAIAAQRARAEAAVRVFGVPAPG
jgi:tripartite-type tricarboxylate transporter receptor subunit TctC